MKLEKLNDDELIDLYPKLLDQLKTRGIIRTKNIIGEFMNILLGVNIKIILSYQNQLNLSSTKNIDATSIKGERHAIKSTSTNTWCIPLDTY